MDNVNICRLLTQTPLAYTLSNPRLRPAGFVRGYNLSSAAQTVAMI